MNPALGSKETIIVGNPVVIETDAPDGSRGVVFEDDGRTGYFYARDYSVPKQLFVDALHIYSVEGVTHKELSSTVHVLWSSDYSKAALIINNSPHAVFDFVTKIGFSRDQFPAPDQRTGWIHKPWDDALRIHFYGTCPKP